MTTLVFDQEQAARLKELYMSPDVVARRRTARGMLGARPGERVLDIGCGPGIFAAELAADVGPSGGVVAIDSSPQMLSLARTTIAESVEGAPVELMEGEATALPSDAESFDATVCVQVLEYVKDVPKALSEMYRVLRPGGRALIWDTDWHALVWQSEDADRMKRILDAWEEHLVHPALPRMLGVQLQEAGFDATTVEGHLTVNLQPGPSNYSAGMISLIQPFVTGRQGISAEDVESWVQELHTLAAEGRYYLASPQFCFVAQRP